MFRAIYESTWYHPVLFWIAGGAFVLAIAKRLPFLYAYLVAFAFEIIADATLTSPWSPVAAGTHWATIVAIVFVVLGDLRFFLLVERARAGALTRRAWGVALGLSLVVPAASFVAQAVAPSAFVDGRVTFLVYEAMFVALALGVRVWLPRRAWARDVDRRWSFFATHFEIVQYALWALADVVILSGHDVGYALRLVPNTMYYVLYLPFVAWSAPRDLADPWREARA